MKTTYQFLGMVMLLLTTLLTGCEGEKEMIIIEEQLPIKTSTLFMVGDAAPCGWDINNPTPFTATEEEPLIFIYEGKLNKGEFKCCIKAGNWGNPFIRPMVGGTEINQDGIAETPFAMHAGDPDDKWRVTHDAIYRLTFNLRLWTMQAEYLGEVPLDPIQTETLFIIGGATPNGWDMGNATALSKDSNDPYLFSAEVSLKAGETFKAFMVKDDTWSQEFLHPVVADCAVSKSGVADNGFKCYKGGEDLQWKVIDDGRYRLSFDLKHYTLTVTFLD